MINSFAKCIVLSSFLLCPVFGQNLIFHHYSIDQGMSQNTIESIIQDRNGFMWFGTQDGVNRYDGYRFHVLRRDRIDQNSLSDNFVTSMFEDSKGRIWIGTNSGGLNCYLPGNKQFILYTHDPQNPHSINSNNIRAITENKTGHILIGTMGGGLSIFDLQKNEFINYVNNQEDPFSLSHNNVRSVCVDHLNRAWIGTEGGGLNRMQIKTDGSAQFIHYANESGNINSISDNNITAVTEIKPGIMLAGSITGGLIRIDVNKELISVYMNDETDPNSISGNNINAIYRDSKNRIWIGTDNNGLNQYNDKNRSFIRYSHSALSVSTISSNQILSICEDRSGLLWIGTRDKGVTKVDPQGNKFMHYKSIPGEKNSLAFNTIRSINSSDADILWLGTFGQGLDKFDRKNKTFTHYQSSESNPYSLNNNHISALCVDQNGVLWVGTWGGGLNKKGPSNKFKQFEYHPGESMPISDLRIQAILDDGWNGLWIGTENGLNYFNKSTEKFQHFFHNPLDENSISDNRVQSNCIKTDKWGRLWVGTWNGLNQITLNEDKKSIKQVIRFQSDPGEVNSLSDNRVTSLIIDDESSNEQDVVLWIGTYTGGLNKLVIRESGGTERPKVLFRHFGIREGLLSDIIYGLQKDKNGNIWMSTNYGLFRLNNNMAQGDLVKIYTTADGLQSNQFFWGASHQNAQGEMIFGGINGFNIFHPDSIVINKNMPIIHITGFKKNNKEVDFEKEIYNLDKINLTYEDHVFSFQFAAIDYASPGKNQYAYMMEGFDTDWIYAKNRHEATYTNLDPGEYIFRVKGSNNDGVWNEKGASIIIDIAPPWYSTLWFRLIALSSLIGVITILYRLRTANIKQRNKELEEHNIKLNEQIIERERLQSQLTQAQKMESIGILAGGVAHDFNNLLTVINGHAELGLIKKDKAAIQKDLHAILTSGKRAISLTSQLLAFSRKQVIQPVATNVNRVIRNIEKMLRSLTGDDITLETILDPIVPDTKADIGQLEQIIMNLVINARDAINEKQGKKTTKTISIKTDLVTLGNTDIKNHLSGSVGPNILITINDTGIGMDEKIQNKIFDPFFTTKERGKGTGLGLSTVYGIIKQNNAGIAVYSEPGVGTSIKIFWPIHEISEGEITNIEETTTIRRGTGTILLVEDDEHVCSFVQESLTGMGYTIHTYNNGEQALKFLKKENKKIDLIITDMIMPGINGQELAKRALDLRSDLKILFSSGYTDNHIVNKGFLEEGVNFIQKPYSISELSKKVHKVLTG